MDYAAATPLDKRVFAVMEPYLTDHFYNPSALYMPARQVRADYEAARHNLAKVIGAKQSEIIITAGATESINLAIHGCLRQYGGAILTSSIEHAAVLGASSHYDMQVAVADSRGFVTPEAVKAVMTPETSLVSVGYVNNELGVVQPIKEIALVVASERQRRLNAGETKTIFMHTDASQAAGLLDVSVARLGVDMMTLNSGKCYGPKQVGLLWVRSGVELVSLIDGGGQEQGLRSGSENVAGAIGFTEALSIAQAERKDESYRLSGLRSQLEKGLLSAIDGLTINGHPKRYAPHILHVSIPNVDGERLVYALDNRGLLAATGSACSANKGIRSHVLTAIGLSAELADSSLRLSIGRFTTSQEIEKAITLITEVAKQEAGK